MLSKLNKSQNKKVSSISNAKPRSITQTSLQFAHGNSQLILIFNLARTLSFLSLICKCEALSGALERLVLTKDIIIKILSKQKNTSYGFTETRQKDHWKIISLWTGREWNTHFRWWICANGNGWSQGTTEVLVIGLHMVGLIEYRIIFKVSGV